MVVKTGITSVDYSSGKHLHCFLFKRQEDIDLNQHQVDVSKRVKRSGRRGSLDPSEDGTCYDTRVHPTNSCTNCLSFYWQN